MRLFELLTCGVLVSFLVAENKLFQIYVSSSVLWFQEIDSLASQKPPRQIQKVIVGYAGRRNDSRYWCISTRLPKTPIRTSKIGPDAEISPSDIPRNLFSFGFGSTLVRTTQ